MRACVCVERKALKSQNKRNHIGSRRKNETKERKVGTKNNERQLNGWQARQERQEKQEYKYTKRAKTAAKQQQQHQDQQQQQQ